MDGSPGWRASTAALDHARCVVVFDLDARAEGEGVGPTRAVSARAVSARRRIRGRGGGAIGLGRHTMSDHLDARVRSRARGVRARRGGWG